jgi:hypothetical protein
LSNSSNSSNCYPVPLELDISGRVLDKIRHTFCMVVQLLQGWKPRHVWVSLKNWINWTSWTRFAVVLFFQGSTPRNWTTGIGRIQFFHVQNRPFLSKTCPPLSNSNPGTVRFLDAKGKVDPRHEGHIQTSTPCPS